MIGSTRQVMVWAHGAPADLRKGFDGLSALVTHTLERDPLSGDCYLFVNATRKRAKVLLWDGTGLCIYAKRLEQGRFACLWRDATARVVRLTMSELQLFLEGSTLVGRVALSPAPFDMDFSQKPLATRRRWWCSTTMRSVQDIDDPDMLRQVAVLLERENATLHAKLHALAEELARLRGDTTLTLQHELAFLPGGE